MDQRWAGLLAERSNKIPHPQAETRQRFRVPRSLGAGLRSRGMNTRPEPLVLRDLEDLPEHVSRAIRVCAYRVVQEALNNSYKHAGGHRQRVSARLDGKLLEIVVADSGVAPTSQLHDPTRSAKLGLRGMDSRIRALRGSLTIARLVNGGTGNSSDFAGAFIAGWPISTSAPAAKRAWPRRPRDLASVPRSPLPTCCARSACA